MTTTEPITLLVIDGEPFGIHCQRIDCSCGWRTPWWPTHHDTTRTRLAASAAHHYRAHHAPTPPTHNGTDHRAQ